MVRGDFPFRDGPGILTFLASAPAAPHTAVPTPPAASAVKPSGASTALEAQTVPLSPAVAEALRLVDGGVSEEVVKSYVESSPVGFALTADQIVALKERGVPPDVVVAMLTRNKELRTLAAQARLASNQLGSLSQRGYSPPVAPGYPAIQSAAYAPQGPDYQAPFGYNYSYPAYSYSNWTYPLSSTWWWTPVGGCYPYGRCYPYSYAYYQHRGHLGYYGASYWPHGWADAYPNRLIAGPTWGGDRGFVPGAAGSQRRWADAYPNRLIAGPTWGETAALPLAGLVLATLG